MAFYTYRQNNPGGRFTRSADLAEFVIVEACCALAANAKLEALGGYFNGVGRGNDCACCGDRWDPCEERDAMPVPTLYGEPVSEKDPKRAAQLKIHYLFPEVAT